jgi:hypothetical protein
LACSLAAANEGEKKRENEGENEGENEREKKREQLFAALCTES